MPIQYTRNTEGKATEHTAGEETPKAANPQPNNPLHGVKLADIVTELQAHYGWEELGQRITINCFQNNPTIKSSLKFLRKTPWARDKVEQLWLRTFKSRP